MKDMNVQIKELITGAGEASGLTVIIDVFRAFSLECYMYGAGAGQIISLGSLEEARHQKALHPDAALVGERGGVMCEGFDCGNSPSQIRSIDLAGRLVIHTTSAGTQGVAAAVNADEIITGSLVNAAAVAEYIRRKAPETVTLVAMGNGGVRRANEDVVCARYIRSLLLGKPYPVDEKIKALRMDGGEHFFNPQTQAVFPEEDFYLCIRRDIFPFVITVEKHGELNYMKKVEVPGICGGLSGDRP